MFDDWIKSVQASGASYQRLDRSAGVFDIGDPEVTVEIVGPRLGSDGKSFKWFLGSIPERLESRTRMS